jgi:hypothetical protein
MINSTTTKSAGEDESPRCAEATGSAIDGLRYAKQIVATRRILNRPASYLAALDEIDIYLDAAIHRLETGGQIGPVAYVQTASPNDHAHA